ncbi:MAG TPA: aldo/keto reductase [Steroidobacteraceae bacterium]|nr:aldo/keto reductase [Steroidobacteraceae bacterium]HRX88062.1 aldo/keto reductase [Steroidobacteraceae bacterium]
MQLDHYRLLGHSGLRVSPIALGAMTFSTDSAAAGRNASRADSLAMLEHYARAGGNFIDTANIYNFGQSEQVVGEFIRSDRSRYVVASKYTMGMTEGQPNASGNHRKNLRESVEASLKRLGTDYIDLCWLHMWEFRTPVEEVMRSLDDLVRQGKVLYIAASDTPAWKITEANTLARCHGWTSFIAMQAEYHMIDRTAERELIPMCRDQNIAVLPWSPLASGLLTGKYSRADQGAPASSDMRAGRKAGLQLSGAINDRNLAIVDVVSRVAKSSGATPGQVALAWLLQQPSRPLPIIGARTLEQLTDNLGALQVELSAQQLAELTEATRIEPGFPNKLYANQRLRNMLVDRNAMIEGGWGALYGP